MIAKHFRIGPLLFEYITAFTVSEEVLPAMYVRLAAGLIVLILAISAHTHHAFSAEFDVARPVNLTGPVVEIEWTNPHAWMHIETQDEEGNAQRWAVELVGINGLVRFGFTRKTVKVGEVLTVEGFGARNGSNTANASSIKRAETGETLWASQVPRR